MIATALGLALTLLPTDVGGHSCDTSELARKARAESLFLASELAKHRWQGTHARGQPTIRVVTWMAAMSVDSTDRRPRVPVSRRGSWLGATSSAFLLRTYLDSPRTLAESNTADDNQSRADVDVDVEIHLDCQQQVAAIVLAKYWDYAEQASSHSSALYIGPGTLFHDVFVTINYLEHGSRAVAGCVPMWTSLMESQLGWERNTSFKAPCSGYIIVQEDGRIVPWRRVYGADAGY